ncbi:hypothetical protein ACH4NO_20055 [Streptomyces olivaceus]|uniref:hypothetical protein n=1 Tax=Streptomyces olivaceus TaxID=47716 RepID=UPI00379D8464
MEEEPARPAAPAAPEIPEDSTPPGEGAGRSPRRRGRTTLLIGAAAALGLVAGTCAGVLVQADREPTKLPPLSQAALAPAKGEAPKPLPADQDRQVRTDGDLRELLLKKPRGAETADWAEDSDGWMDVVAYAESYSDMQVFEHLLDSEFRRAAVTGWEVDGDYSVEIRLIQYRQEENLAAAAAVDGSQYFADEENTGDWSIPGTGDGRAFANDRPLPELADSGFPFPYTAEAHARRGDIVMEIWMSGAKRISKKTIMDLAERQMERL